MATNSIHSRMHVPLQCDYGSHSHEAVKSILLSLETGLDQVDKGIVGKNYISRDLQSGRILGLVPLLLLGTHQPLAYKLACVSLLDDDVWLSTHMRAS